MRSCARCHDNLLCACAGAIGCTALKELERHKGLLGAAVSVDEPVEPKEHADPLGVQRDARAVVHARVALGAEDLQPDRPEVGDSWRCNCRPIHLALYISVCTRMPIAVSVVKSFKMESLYLNTRRRTHATPSDCMTRTAQAR